MKVEFVKPGAGFGLGYFEGDVADVADEKAKKLIEAGVAVPAKQDTVETAESKAKPEKAVKPKK